MTGKRGKNSCAYDFYFIKANIIRLMRTYHLSSLKNLFSYLSSWKQYAKPFLNCLLISRNEKGFYEISFAMQAYNRKNYKNEKLVLRNTNENILCYNQSFHYKVAKECSKWGLQLPKIKKWKMVLVNTLYSLVTIELFKMGFKIYKNLRK